MSDTFKMRGQVKVINETQTFDSGFSKREFVITTDDKYPQDIKFEVVKDKTALLDNAQPGQKCEVSFNVRGNEYNGKYYVNLQAWSITWNTTEAVQQPASEPQFDDEMPF